jgi:hypothetical protein
LDPPPPSLVVFLYKIASLPAFQLASPSDLFQLGEDELLGASLLVRGEGEGERERVSV